MNRLVSILFLLFVYGATSLSATDADVVSEVVPCSETFENLTISGDPNSEGVVINENNITFSVSPKVHHSHHHAFGAHYSHFVNAIIAVHNSCLVGFSRTIDKYIYFLRHIII